MTVMRYRIVLVPYPAQGHITPMLHLATALSAHGFEPIVAVPDFIHRRLSNNGTSDHDEQVTLVSIQSGLGEDEHKDFFAIDRAMEDYMPIDFGRILEKDVVESKGGVVCVVVDLLASWAIRVAAKFEIPSVGFWPAMLATYRIIWAIPELIKKGIISDSGTPLYNQHTLEEEEEERELIKKPKLLHNLSAKDLPWLIGNSVSQKSRFNFWLRTISCSSSLPFVLTNSFCQELDPSPAPPLSSGPHILPVGPLLSTMINNNNNHHNLTMWNEDTTCIHWLHQHPPLSVIYVSFGSWVPPIGQDKITELALALESTNRPFLWVLHDDSVWRSGIPKGFMDRVKGRGKVVSWTPQEVVLAHKAVGSYITHCGWNSTVEGIRNGKRFVCYPIAGDQFLNCHFIVKVWGVGVKIEGFGRKEIKESVERVMEREEGREMLERVMELKEKMMGSEGKSNARDNLKMFVSAVENFVKDQKL